jgi:hypothetical protein
MPQEISVSYQAIKSKVYRLVDSLVVGEKTEAEVQESIRRWWDLIHPGDRPIAQKYLLMVLERSVTALDAIGDSFIASGARDSAYSHVAAKRLKLLDRIVKDSAARPAV